MENSVPCRNRHVFSLISGISYKVVMSDQMKFRSSSLSIGMLPGVMMGFKWWVQILFFFLFVFALNVVPDITAESVLGFKDDSETKNFATCEINDNDLDKESSKTEGDNKNKNEKKLFLSEGGWLVSL